MINELTLQKELQNVVTNNVFLYKKYNHNKNKRKDPTYKFFPE